MPFKAGGRATDYEVVDRFADGAGWIAHPGERMRRASHVLRATNAEENETGEKEGAGPGDVWVVDPVDAEGVDDLIAEFGEVRGVVVLVDRHTRDAARVARRHDAPVYVPPFVDAAVDAPTEELAGHLPGTTFEVAQTVDWPMWKEAALYDGDTLVVGDALGTVNYFTAGGERVGVHPFLRLKPPAELQRFRPARILTGHGAGVFEDAPAALQAALAGARRGIPEVWWNGVKSVVGGTLSR